ncbi:hypothetical protein [Klugiella xanthotipulae]|uniref:hypothetical protein n=1 Tax=Klugiella xanthotipulae TaxID=244735 RepID=UPI001FE780F3|nr:hypothetical protein [Klugiella xanthotipulae]
MVFVDVDFLEEGLVAESAGVVIASVIDAGYVCGEFEAVVDVEACFGVVVVVFGEAGIDGVEFGSEGVLFCCELFEGDCVSEVSVQQSVLFCEVFRSTGAEFGGFGPRGRGEPVKLEVERFAEDVYCFARDVDVLVVVRDEVFDVCGV